MAHQVSGGSLQSPQQAAQRLASLSDHLQIITTQSPVQISVEPKQSRVSLQISWNAQPSAASSLVAPAAPAAPPKEQANTVVDRNKEWTLEEVAKHNKEDDCWVIVNGQVLDVTSFLSEHPGGKKAILLYAGRDATEEFNMLHKPDVIDKYAPECVIGRLASSSGGGDRGTDAKAREQLVPSNIESRVSGGTADVLPQERAKASFSLEKLTNYLDGGEDKTKRRRFILSPLAGSDEWDLAERLDWTREEHLRNHVKYFIRVHEPYWDTYKPTRDELAWMAENNVMPGALMNHYTLFLPTIQMHGNDEQIGWWMNKARRCQIIGCYAQTELGHGSNVRGLATTAEYDKASGEFVLNTPTLRSMKWWPGALGKVATHALVYAQLLLNGKEHGVHVFMLQLRDEEHRLLPGIETGDLGPKLGDHANDTGYMRLTDVRIPREFMLARYQEVTSDGRYVVSPDKAKNQKLVYTTMIFTRASMLRWASGSLARAVTIATRYSCVRTQGFINTKKKGASFKDPERQIIDYSIQRYRIFRQLALVYGMKFTSAWMVQHMSQLDTAKDKLADELLELSATSGGLKALCSFITWQGIEDLRKCCGGNGYLLSSGIAPLAANYVWQITAEGDWIVLMLQTARFLIKCLQDAVAGRPLPGPVAYLAGVKKLNLSRPALPHSKSPADFLNLDFLLALFRYAALYTVASAGQEFQTKTASGLPFDEALNVTANELCTAVRIHCYAFILSNFVRSVQEAPDPAIKTVLSRLCAFYACSNIIDEPLWNGLLTADQMRIIKSTVHDLMEKLRPEAVALVDAFDIPDRVLSSAIGRADGNVYEALFDMARRSALNKADPFLGYKEFLQPHLDREFLQRGNTLPNKGKL